MKVEFLQRLKIQVISVREIILCEGRQNSVTAYEYVAYDFLTGRSIILWSSSHREVMETDCRIFKTRQESVPDV